MPVIPLEQRKESIPGTTGSPNMPATDYVGAALEKAGKQVESSSLLLVQQQARIKHLNELNDAQDLAFDYKDGMTQIQLAQAQDTNMTAEHVVEAEQKLRESLFQNPKYTNKSVQDAAKTALRSEFHTVLSNARITDVKRTVDRSKATFDRIRTENSQSAADAATPEEKDNYINASIESFDVLAKEGVYHEAERAAYMNHIGVGYFKTLELKDPTRGLNELKDENNKATQLLNPETKVQLIQHMNVKAKDQVETNTDIILKSDPEFKTEDGKFDYQKAIMSLTDPKIYKDKFGLDAPQAAQFRNILKAEEAYSINIENKQTNEKYNKELDTIGELAVAGKVKDAIQMTRDSEVIPGMEKDKIIKHFRTPAPEGKSNSSSYLEGVEKMYDSSITMEDKKQWLLQNRNYLNMSDFKHLSNVGMSQERSNDKTATKGGIDTIKAALLTPGMTSQTQKERLDAAIKTYESGVMEYKEQLNSPDKIKQYANQVLAMPQFTNVNPIQDMKDDMKRSRGVGISPTSSTPQNTGKKFIGYQDGKPVYDIGGGKAQVGD